MMILSAMVLPFGRVAGKKEKTASGGGALEKGYNTVLLFV